MSDLDSPVTIRHLIFVIYLFILMTVGNQQAEDFQTIAHEHYQGPDPHTPTPPPEREKELQHWVREARKYIGFSRSSLLEKARKGRALLYANTAHNPHHDWIRSNKSLADIVIPEWPTLQADNGTFYSDGQVGMWILAALDDVSAPAESVKQYCIESEKLL